MDEWDVLDYFINNFDTATFDKVNNKYKFTNGLSLFLNDKTYQENPYKIRPKLKKCKKCYNYKSLDFFYKNRHHDDGYNRECNNCKRIYIKKYQKKIYNENKNNSLFQVKLRVRGSVTRIKKQTSYNLNTCEILKCDYDFLNKRLQLDKNLMNHIDHIIPLSWAKTEDELISLGHYSNLQILTIKENTSKNNKFCKVENLNKVYKEHPNITIIKTIIERNLGKIKL